MHAQVHSQKSPPQNTLKHTTFTHLSLPLPLPPIQMCSYVQVFKNNQLVHKLKVGIVEV